MKIKEQTRKLAVGCSKHCFEVVDKTDEVSTHAYGKAKLTWFEFDFQRVLVQNSSLIVSLKRQKTYLMGRLVVKKRIFLIEKLTILLLILHHLIIVISLK